MHRAVLLIDDEPTSLRVLQRYFERLGWKPYPTASPQEAVAIFDRIRPPLVLLDLQMPILSGLELLEILRERDPDSAIVMLTGHASVDTAVTAMRLGAENYLTKPVSLEHLGALAEKSFETVSLRRNNRILAGQQTAGHSPTGAAVRSSALMGDLEDQIEHVASTSATVLLIGESGTGKTAVARGIHGHSARAAAPFIEVNCAGLSRENLEQKLFGQERVTSRGRKVEPRGLFELADGGTLMLDQIGMLDAELQPKLLQVLETRRFLRVGGTTEIEVDVRMIAATTPDLEENVRDGHFREDLYYRLAVVPLRLPPLRERSREEILAIATAILGQLSSQLGAGLPASISPEAEDRLGRYAWPGNIREMRNLFERILILNPGIQVIDEEHLPAEVHSRVRDGGPLALDPTMPLEEVEREHILRALRHHNGNRSAAAKSLRISRRSLYDKLEKYGISSAVPPPSG